MTPQQAYELIDKALSIMQLTRQDHINLQQALQILKPKEEE